MTRASDAANGLMRGVEDLCGLYRVPCFRMQSRVVTVAGAGGRSRPMFMGKWTDSLGQEHAGGMADFLLTPRVLIRDLPIQQNVTVVLPPALSLHVTVPLWVEVKQGTGKLTKEQQLFRDYITETKGHYLLVHDDPNILLDYFQDNGVAKR